MANIKKFYVKNGLHTQNIDFVSPDETNTMSMEMTDNDVISISGDSGQLFSITDSLEGTIFSVNDISGVPSIEVDDDGEIRLAETFGEVLIGTDTTNGVDKLQINGSTYIGGLLNVGNGTQEASIIINSLSDTNGDDIQFYNNGARVGEIGTTDSIWLRINQTTNKNIYTPRYIRADQGLFVDDTNHGIDASGKLLPASLYGTYDLATTFNNASSVITASNKWSTARTITLGGDLTGNVSIDGSSNVTLTADVVDDSHNHIISNIDNLQSTLDGKLNTTANNYDLRLNSSNGRGMRFWDSDSYKIYMSATSDATFGGRISGETTSDYNIYLRIGGGTNRGFVFESVVGTKLLAINPDGVRSNEAIYCPTPTTGDNSTKVATTAFVSTSISNMGKVYNHTQASANTTWTITHNLNERLVEIIVSDGSYIKIVPNEITFTSVNQVTLTFFEAVSGYAKIIG